MLTNLRDAFIGQSRSPNIAPFHMLGIVSYCAIETKSLRRAVFTIFDLQVLMEMSPCDRGHTTSYSRSIVTMALSRVVSEIFNVE